MPWHHNTKLNTCLSLSKSWVIWEESMKQKAITLAILASIWSSSEGFYAESCSITFSYLSGRIITFSLHHQKLLWPPVILMSLALFFCFSFLFLRASFAPCLLSVMCCTSLWHFLFLISALHISTLGILVHISSWDIGSQHLFVWLNVLYLGCSW